MKSIFNYHRLKVLISIIWSVAITFNLPKLIYYQITIIEGFNLKICTNEWDYSIYYDIVDAILFYLLPVILLIFVYGRIGFKLFFMWNVSTSFLNETLHENHISIKKQESKITLTHHSRSGSFKHDSNYQEKGKKVKEIIGNKTKKLKF